MTKLQFGLQIYSVRDHCQNKEDMLACLKGLKAMGYNVCQLAGQSRDITPAELRALLDESGMECPAIHTSYERMRDDFDAFVKDMKTIGCRYLGVGMPGEYKTPEGIVRFAKEASAIGAKLAKEGMKLMYHNHAYEFERLEETGKTIFEMLAENSDENLFFELDLFWVQRGGANPIDMLHKMKGRMVTSHIKDMNGSADNANVIAPIGKGNLNFGAIIPACDECGVEYVFIEQDNAPETDSMACVEYSLNTLKKMGGRF